jgi:hypothetical protein
MSTWKRIAIKLFPEHTSGSDAFQKPHMNIYQVFFQLKEDAEEYVRSNNQEGLERIFKFVEWCHEQGDRNPDIWNAAATAFLEHMADDDEGAVMIPVWVKPVVFKDMESEFKKRRERDGEGKFQLLLDNYKEIYPDYQANHE